MLFPTWHRPYLAMMEVSHSAVAIRDSTDWAEHLPANDLSQNVKDRGTISRFQETA